ncbi:MAG: class I SAM-dependent methyltransferase [Lachnospiraceae bacterium]|jgi:ubiquinone/menaquinone biosynthesis C-methylase UbiE|nr:class I SAM-dependent methyltransferase [Lachnospiraceae bacterium]
MKPSQKDFKFDKRAASYDSGFEGKLSSKFYNALLSQVKLQDGFSVLDVGCGTGYVLRKMASSTSIHGYGIDVEDEMIAVARKKCPDMTIQRSPCENTPFSDCQFDVLTACMAYHHFSDKAGFIKEASKILKPGGCLYIADPFFPYPIRKIINAILKLVRLTGKFFTAHEIETDFSKEGFKMSSVYKSGIVQVLTLVKS